MLRGQLCPFRSQGFKDLVASAAAISELQSPQLEESIHTAVACANQVNP
jgi:hypothetical protein